MLISNNLRQQDWRTANNNFHKLHWVHRRNYESLDPRMLEILDRLIAWHLLAINLKTGLHPGEHFLKLLELNHRTLEIVDNFVDVFVYFFIAPTLGHQQFFQTFGMVLDSVMALV